MTDRIKSNGRIVYQQAHGPTRLFNFDNSQVSAWGSRERSCSKENRGFGMASTAIRYGCKKRQQVQRHFYCTLLPPPAPQKGYREMENGVKMWRHEGEREFKKKKNGSQVFHLPICKSGHVTEWASRMKDGAHINVTDYAPK